MAYTVDINVQMTLTALILAFDLLDRGVDLLLGEALAVDVVNGDVVVGTEHRSFFVRSRFHS